MSEESEIVPLILIYQKLLIDNFSNICPFGFKGSFYVLLSADYYPKKPHTCEEGGEHLKISFWHLLMNLKNKYLFNEMLKWANNEQNNFNIYNVALF